MVGSVIGSSPAASRTDLGWIVQAWVLWASAIRMVPYGSLRRNSIVASSTAVSSAVFSIRRWPTPLIRPHRSTEAIASAAVSGSPLWNVTPWRRVIVWVRPSSLTVWVSTSSGIGWYSAS